ncbi:MAG: hypothetical protein IV097_15825 [Burkholderiaceae bacterium]|nr:hypothetical protein [Burkholderiaceae bacterium]
MSPSRTRRQALALLIHGIGLSTHGTGGAAASLPALVVLAAVCLLMAMAAALKRGRDLGWPAWQTVLGFWICLGLGPLLLVLVGYLAGAKTKPRADAFEPAPPPAGIGTWLLALLNLLWPWAVLGMLAAVL